MSITKNSYQTSHSIKPYYVRVQEDLSRSDFIIIDDVEYNGNQGSLYKETNGGTIWIKVETNSQVTVLSSAPSGVTPFTPSHTGWTRSRIYIQGETFVVHYSSIPMDDATNRDEVTGYSMDSFDDVLYIKIDHSADTVTIYH